MILVDDNCHLFKFLAQVNDETVLIELFDVCHEYDVIFPSKSVMVADGGNEFGAGAGKPRIIWLP